MGVALAGAAAGADAGGAETGTEGAGLGLATAGEAVAVGWLAGGRAGGQYRGGQVCRLLRAAEEHHTDHCHDDQEHAHSGQQQDARAAAPCRREIASRQPTQRRRVPLGAPIALGERPPVVGLRCSRCRAGHV